MYREHTFVPLSKNSKADLSKIGKRFNNIIVYKVLGRSLTASNRVFFECFCTRCLTFSEVSIEYMKRSTPKFCRNCKNTKTSIEDAIDVYKLKILEGLTFTKIAEIKNMSRNRATFAFTMGARAVNTVNSEKFKEFLKWAKENNLIKDTDLKGIENG